MPLFRRRRAPLGTTEAGECSAPPPAPHLLICDDNITVTKLLQVLFDAAGWTVEVTQNGRECLAALEKRSPDVMVLDQRLYFGLNGLQIAELARKGGFDRPIVLFSAHLDEATQQWARRLQVLSVSKVDTAAVVRQVKEAHRSYCARTAPRAAEQRRAAPTRSSTVEGPARGRGEAPA
jgi:CheY-like chemotaxis protein